MGIFPRIMFLEHCCKAQYEDHKRQGVTPDIDGLIRCLKKTFETVWDWWIALSIGRNYERFPKKRGHLIKIQQRSLITILQYLLVVVICQALLDFVNQNPVVFAFASLELRIRVWIFFLTCPFAHGYEEVSQNFSSRIFVSISRLLSAWLVSVNFPEQSSNAI